jgi:hypothetical protein
VKKKKKAVVVRRQEEGPTTLILVICVFPLFLDHLARGLSSLLFFSNGIKH